MQLRRVGLVLATLFLLTLMGCTFVPARYNAAGLPDADLAVIRTADKYVSFAQVIAVYDADGTRVIGTDSWTAQDRWKEVFLQPGRYKIDVYCGYALGSATSTLRAQLDPGRQYFLECFPVKKPGLIDGEESEHIEGKLVDVTGQ